MTAEPGTPRGVVAVTGATGFLGQHVIAALAADGWRLRLLVRRHPGDALAGMLAGATTTDTAPGATGPAGHAPAAVEIVMGTLAERDALDRLVRGATAIVHLAGAIKARDRAGFMAANAEGTARLGDAWRAAAPEAAMVLVSSLAAREPGLSSYAASKRAGEDRLAESAAGAPFAILRPAAVYGPGDRETLALFRAARWPVQPMLQGPSARLCLIHARDVAGAVASALRSRAGPQLVWDPPIWELSDARTDGYAWPEVVRAAAGALGRTARPARVPAALLAAIARAGDAAALIGRSPAMLTSQKLPEILHTDWSTKPENRPPSGIWTPRITLSDGFAETVSWYRAHKWL